MTMQSEVDLLRFQANQSAPGAMHHQDVALRAAYHHHLHQTDPAAPYGLPPSQLHLDAASKQNSNQYHLAASRLPATPKSTTTALHEQSLPLSSMPFREASSYPSTLPARSSPTPYASPLHADAFPAKREPFTSNNSNAFSPGLPSFTSVLSGMPKTLSSPYARSLAPLSSSPAAPSVQPTPPSSPTFHPKDDVAAFSSIQQSNNNNKLLIDGIPFEDVLALKNFLDTVDTRHYGFKYQPDMNLPANASSIIKSSRPLPPSSPYPNRSNGSGFAETMQRPRQQRLPRPLLDDLSSLSSDEEMPIKLQKLSSSRKQLKSRTALSDYDHSSASRSLPSPISSPSNANNVHALSSSAFSNKSVLPPKPRSPYRGKHGPNPQCTSCGTTKTPYWRDAWQQGNLLCNACGLRFAKFKRRCTGCHYVPRKEDKGGRQCPHCGGAWTQ